MNTNLDTQLQELIDDAPQDGVTPALIEAIAPVLKQLAFQLRHPEYYIAQTLEQNWAVTLLNHETQSDLQKQIIYAFPNLKDVSSGPYPMKDPQMIALPIPVIHILFQIVAMETVDSVVFFEVPGNTMVGTEVKRADLQTLIQAQLMQHPLGPNSVPPDIA
ncbi:MAG: hypothetical protein LH647_19140 [Leptolyngbyaceae cyanobacterium CAN_BIN12]|nr:hypothetical protein [Leptolyngbyaceae cyanobacterium CAN_BIN12]